MFQAFKLLLLLLVLLVTVDVLPHSAGIFYVRLLLPDSPTYTEKQQRVDEELDKLERERRSSMDLQSRT